jgi:hypothetical protein
MTTNVYVSVTSIPEVETMIVESSDDQAYPDRGENHTVSITAPDGESWVQIMLEMIRPLEKAYGYEFTRLREFLGEQPSDTFGEDDDE